MQLDALVVAEKRAARLQQMVLQLVEENAMLEAYVQQLTTDSPAAPAATGAWGPDEPTPNPT